jgi:stage IV sporulation protein FB
VNEGFRLRVRILGIPVTIGPWIVLGLGVLGLVSHFQAILLIEWIVLGIAALLIHELGHALAFRHYGVSSSISFWILGGVTIPDDLEAAGRLSDRQLLLVSVAGPLAGLVAGGVSALALVALASAGPSIRMPVALFVFVNVAWSIFNLLPITALDGGRALSALMGAVFGRLGRVFGTILNMITSVVIAALAWSVGEPYIAFIAISFGLVASFGTLAQQLDQMWPDRAERLAKQGEHSQEAWQDESERRRAEDRAVGTRRDLGTNPHDYLRH